ncbi:hypothetical protein AAMO2058_000140500 [Amorphochlora amoebiformis]
MLQYVRLGVLTRREKPPCRWLISLQSALGVHKPAPGPSMPQPVLMDRDRKAIPAYVLAVRRSHGTSNRRLTRQEKKQLREAPRKPKRPKTAYNFFQQAESLRLRGLAVQNAKIAKEIGLRWRTLPDAQRRVYQNWASMDKIRFQREYQEYITGIRRAENGTNPALRLKSRALKRRRDETQLSGVRMDFNIQRCVPSKKLYVDSDDYQPAKTARRMCSTTPSVSMTSIRNSMFMPMVKPMTPPMVFQPEAKSSNTLGTTLIEVPQSAQTPAPAISLELKSPHSYSASQLPPLVDCASQYSSDDSNSELSSTAFLNTVNLVQETTTASHQLHFTNSNLAPSTNTIASRDHLNVLAKVPYSDLFLHPGKPSKFSTNHHLDHAPIETWDRRRLPDLFDLQL